VIESPTLLQWGLPGAESSPKGSFMFDIFTRIGGPAFRGFKGNQARAKVSIQIDADNVTSDHLWLWRGDHYLNEEESTDASTPDDIGITKLGELYNANGLTVTGNHVRVYNLAVEHAVEDQVSWSGEDGEVYFFQCEIPYDVDERWSTAGFVSYRVTGNVQRHKAYGIGTYAYFNAFPVWMKTGFDVPVTVQHDIVGAFIVKLSQAPEVADNGGSGILSTINCKGPGVGLNGDYFELQLFCSSADGAFSLASNDTRYEVCPYKPSPSPAPPAPPRDEAPPDNGGNPWFVWAAAWILSLVVTAAVVWVLAQRTFASRVGSIQMTENLTPA